MFSSVKITVRKATDNPIIEHLSLSTFLRSTKAVSLIYFSPIPQGWGMVIYTLSGGLKA